MLKVTNITKSFGGVRAIKGSDFMIEEGKVTALIGPNGAGKTTLFDIICGFIKPDTGDVTFQGTLLNKKAPHTRIRAGISRTFQQVRLFHNLTILEHLRMADDHDDTKFFKNIFTKANVDTKPYQDVLDQFGITKDVTALAKDLSYGQQKLLDIILALRADHKLLMLDEPVAGVNHVVQSQIEDLLLELKKKQETMLLIDHDMSFVRRLADHVIVLDAGVVLLEGPPETVLKDERVLEAYLGT